MHAIDFPRTKLLPPATASLIERGTLVAQVSDGAERCRLTLISAPAGSGKTTLLAAVAQALQENGRAVAWLTLDADDNESHRFAQALAAALQTLNPAFGERALALLTDARQEQSPRLLMGALVNDMVEALPGPFALVLDDLHELRRDDLWKALDYLVERMPAQARLVVASRHDPPLSLARLRVRGDLSEFRLETMRFSPDDVRRLLNDQFDLRLDAGQIERIYSRTEGWAAGIQLIGLALAQQSPQQRADAIQGIGVERQHIFDLLAEEVLSQQDESTQRFLLDTSILMELTPSLCQAVTGRADAAEVLQDLHKRNLFVVALDPARESYRYHALFREFLQHRLSRTRPQDVRALHLRAGQAEPDDVRAVHHLLEAQAWEAAAERIEAAATRLREHGLDVPRSWLAALPSNLIEQRVGLSYLAGVLAEDDGDFVAARPALQRAVDLYAAAGDLEMQGDAIGHLASVVPDDFSPESMAESGRLAALALSMPLSLRARMRALIGRMWVHIIAGDVPSFSAALNEILRTAMASTDALLAYDAVAGINPTVTAVAPDVHLMTDFVNVMMARYGEGYGRMQVCVLTLMGGLRQLEGRLTDAYDAASRAARTMENTGEVVYVGVSNDFVLAALALARGDWRAVDALVQRRYPVVNAVSGNRGIGFLYHLHLAYAHWIAGHGEQVERLARDLRAGASPSHLPEYGLAADLMDSLADLVRDDAMRAVRRLEPVAARYHLSLGTAYIQDPRWLLGYAWWKLRRYDDALAAISPALSHAQSRGWPGYILIEGQYVKPLLQLTINRKLYAGIAQRALDILESAGGATFVSIPGSNDSLSPREMDVLRLLVEGASNQAIADALSVSVWTVKSHVTSILAKLGATSRTQAVARARELRVI